MNAKLLLIGSLLAGLTIFAWGALSHTAIMPEPFTVLKDGKAVLDFVDAHAATNGAYYDARGILLINALLPDRSDRAQHMGGQLAREFVSNVIQAGMLLFILWRMGPATIGRRACQGAFLGLTAWVGISFSLWNWYGFPPLMVLSDLVDLLVGWALAAMVLGWALKKWGAPPSASNA